MILNQIDIVNFKNIESASLEFSQGVNCLLGMNGMGKSNLLEAIHFLSMTRPMSPIPDNLLIRHGQPMMMAKGSYLTDSGGHDRISCGITRGKGKTLKRNDKEYQKISEHIGRYPVVTVTPNDTRIVSGSGEDRRKLMDMVISQAHPDYLKSLIRYNKSLDSRNRMLRAGVKDSLLYESVEAQMIETAQKIHQMRKDWVREMAPEVESNYLKVAGEKETTEINYKSQLNESSMEELLKERRQKDTVLGFTSGGIHRDDFEGRLYDYPIKSIGSQGQLKSFLIALRFAIFNYLKKANGLVPLLLLDDIFDKLDSERVENIMKEVTGSGTFGQIFITDTNRKHLDDILDSIGGDKTLLNVENGNFSKIIA